MMPRVGKAGRYRYCLRCGTRFTMPELEAPRHWRTCSGIPAGEPTPNPAHSTRKPNLDSQGHQRRNRIR